MGFFRDFFGDLSTPLYKNAIFLMTNTIVANGLGFFFWVIIARLFDPPVVGLAATIIPIMLLIGMLSGLGFGMGLVRFLPGSGKDSTAMINSCFTISSLTAISISVIFLLGLDIWSPALLFARENWLFILSFIIFSVVFALFPMMNQVFVARRRAKFVLMSTSVNGLKILFPLIFVWLFGALSFGIFASWSLGMLIALMVGVFVFIRMVNPGYRPFPTVKKRVVKEMMRFSAGNYAAGILGMLPRSLLPIIIINILNPQNVAYYYVAFTVASLLFAMAQAVWMSLFAEGSHFEKELGTNVRKALKFVIIVLVPAVIIVSFLSKYLLLLFGSDYSSEGLLLLQIFSISSILVAFVGIFLATRRVLKRLKPIVAIPAFNAIAILGLGYVLLTTMGLVGIAVAWILGWSMTSAGIGIYLLWEKRKSEQTRKTKGLYS